MLGLEMSVTVNRAIARRPVDSVPVDVIGLGSGVT